MTTVDVADTDPTKAHPLLQQRLASLELKLAAEGLVVQVIEIYRSNLRQQWLFGAGRTTEQLIAEGVPASFARPALAVVTNAWSAATSAHGWTENGLPAACAVDVDPVGADGRPWTADDPWDAFVAACEALSAEVGLRHFRNCHGLISDRPHLQLCEWDDHQHRLVLPAATPPLQAA